jgi:hypothetical protein
MKAAPSRKRAAVNYAEDDDDDDDDVQVSGPSCRSCLYVFFVRPVCALLLF